MRAYVWKSFREKSDPGWELIQKYSNSNPKRQMTEKLAKFVLIRLGFNEESIKLV